MRWPRRDPPAPLANTDHHLARDFVSRLQSSGTGMTHLSAESTRLQILADYSGLRLPGSKHECKLDWFRSESIRRICMDILAVAADEAAEASRASQ